MRALDARAQQQLGDLLGGHRRTPVGVQHCRGDAVGRRQDFDEFRGPRPELGPPHFVVGHAPGVDVDDHVGVEVLAPAGAFEAGDAGGEHLSRSVRPQFGHRLGRMGGGAAPHPGLAVCAQDPVHRGHRAVVAALVQFPGPDLGGRKVGVGGAVHQLQHPGPLIVGQGGRVRGPRGRLGRFGRVQAPVVGGPGAAGQAARRDDADRAA